MFDFLGNKKADEAKLIKKASSHLLAFVDEFKSYILTDRDEDDSKIQLALLLIYLGAADGAMNRYEISYEGFLSLVDDFFERIGVEAIFTEILLDYHMDHAGNLVAWEAVQEGKERYYQWATVVKNWEVRGHQAFWGNYLSHEDFPKTVGDLMMTVAEIEKLGDLNSKSSEVVFEEIIEDL